MNSWHRRPGDRIVRRPRIRRHHLRRVLGVPGLFSAGYGDVGSSIYYALGIVALVALGATPVALAVAGIFFVFTALTYAEGTAMLPGAGGSASFARAGFNDLVSFIAGWALMLSYIVTIAISAFTIPPYLGHFWPILKTLPFWGTAASMGIVALLMLINVVGIREASALNIGAALIDLLTQALLIAAGFVLLFQPEIFVQNVTLYWPTPSNLVFGIALASVAYTGVETISQMAEETRRPEVRVPIALVFVMIAVIIIYSGISLVALSAMTPQELSEGWARDPVAGIAHALPREDLRGLFQPLVGVLAATILLIASNAGLMGSSRLAFFMASHRQIPSIFGHVHSRFRTPYISIILFSIVALLILSPGLLAHGEGIFTNLGALYTFGSLLAFALAHASIVALRIRRPDLPRPFKLGPNLRIKGRELPLTALIGAIIIFTIWVLIWTIWPWSRWVGFAWMGLGLLLYLGYRRWAGLPFTHPLESQR